MMTLLACTFKTGDDLIIIFPSRNRIFPSELLVLWLVFLGEGAAGSNYGYTNSGYSVYEEENEKLAESLRSKVTAIKSVSMSLY